MPIPSKQKPFTRSIMREEVYDTLFNWIMKGEMRPGEKLLDKQLAESMGISRTPVREALRRLEDKGLVESSANRWTRVSEVSIEEPIWVYPIIWTLEELAVSQAIDLLTNDDFILMEQINEELREMIAAGNPVEASLADIEFHDVFINRSGNPHLMSILHDLKITYRRAEVIYFEKSADGRCSIDEHLKILAALRERKEQDAQTLIRLNWQNSLKRIQQLGEKNQETEWPQESSDEN